MIRHCLLNKDNFEKIAVIDDGEKFSYLHLAQKTAKLQQQLNSLKLNEQENIGIFLPNSVNYIIALFGTIISGMRAFPLNVQLTYHEIILLLEKGHVHIVLSTKSYKVLWEDIMKIIPLKVIYLEELGEIEKGLLPQPAHIEPDEPMILLNTSGTTGNVKIVQLSEKNVLASTLAYLDKMDFTKISQKQIKFTLGTPFSTVYALMIICACMIKSFPIVVLKEAFTLDMLYKLAEGEKITHFEGGVAVGFLLEQNIGRTHSYDLTSLCYFGLAGSHLPKTTLKRLIDAYPKIEFWTGYGMTEAGPLIAKPDKKVNINKLDSVGTKANGTSIMIDVNGALTDTANIKGEIVVKGANVMLGYYENEKQTAKVLKNGWLYTGDIGYLDEEGYLYICGRMRNIIIVRGFNVQAEEVEECILSSALVQDCLVYAKKDCWGNEMICADIVSINSNTAIDEITHYCQTHLAPYKQPRQITLLDFLEKTNTGKTQRKLSSSLVTEK